MLSDQSSIGFRVQITIYVYVYTQIAIYISKLQYIYLNAASNVRFIYNATHLFVYLHTVPCISCMQFFYIHIYLRYVPYVGPHPTNNMAASSGSFFDSLIRATRGTRNHLSTNQSAWTVQNCGVADLTNMSKF